MKSIQLNAFIETGIFQVKISCFIGSAVCILALIDSQHPLQSYVVKEDPVRFRLNLSVLLECLNVFGSSIASGTTPALKLYYSGDGSPVTLL